MLYFNNQFIYNAKMNLAIEEIIFQDVFKDEPILLLWQNNNSVIIGKNQYTENEINKPYIEEKNIEIVRRITGGGTVYHDLGNLNFSVMFDNQKNKIDEFLNIICKSLEDYQIKVEKSGRNDLIINTSKISGSSVLIKKNSILLHGTILIDSDLEKLTKTLNPPREKFLNKKIDSVKSRVQNLKSFNSNVSVSNLVARILLNFKEKFKLNKLILNKKLVEKAIKLKHTKYNRNYWNFNQKLNKKMITKRFPSGTISINYQIEKNRIIDLNFFGDFFSREDINKLSYLLKGNKLSDLEDLINQININDFILGIKKEEFLELFRGID